MKGLIMVDKPFISFICHSSAMLYSADIKMVVRFVADVVPFFT